MADQQAYPNIAALRKLEASLNMHLRDQSAAHDTPRPIAITFRLRVRRLNRRDWRMRLMLWWPRLRKLTLVAGTLGGVTLLALGALWWRLSSGPIELDLATPWLTAAIKQNFGVGHEVEVGGTQLERDASGRTALRIRDIVVRDADGTIVASAPKAEVGVSGIGPDDRPHPRRASQSRRRRDGGADRASTARSRYSPAATSAPSSPLRPLPLRSLRALRSPRLSGSSDCADRHRPGGGRSHAATPQRCSRLCRAARLDREPRRERA